MWMSDFNQDSNAYFVRICFDGTELSAQEISEAARKTLVASIELNKEN